jgi:branched-subunit amino acid transport protein AzlD
METSMWLALISIALGTYLLRLFPYLWMKGALMKKQVEGGINAMPSWITILGPMMIAAMFGTSLAPAHLDTVSWLATAAGTLATFTVWARTRSMGLPVLCGVATFGMIMLWH